MKSGKCEQPLIWWDICLEMRLLGQKWIKIIPVHGYPKTSSETQRYIVVARGSPNVYSFPRQHYYICRWVSLVCEDGEVQEYIKHIARWNVIRQFTIAKIGLKVMKKNISRIKVKGFIVPSVCSSSMSWNVCCQTIVNEIKCLTLP